MDLSTIKDEKELKALAYDELVKKEVAESNLRAINQRLAELEQEAGKESKPSDKSSS